MATKSPISGHVVLQPIFDITANLASNRKNYTRNNPPFRTKLMAALHDSSLATDK